MAPSDLFTSRYVRRNDPFVERIVVRRGWLRRPLRWELARMRWWSRMFEYRWLAAAPPAFWGGAIRQRRALDAGCGPSHPGCFLLARAGFATVHAQDVFPRHALIAGAPFAGLSYIQRDLSEPIPERYDCICCISTLEHVPPGQQPLVLEHLAAAVAPGGVLLLTFDMPGFEYDTDLALYLRVLRERGFAVDEREVPPAERLSSRNGPVALPGWPAQGRGELWCYRVFAVRQ